jgi:hypothetical protein
MLPATAAPGYQSLSGPDVGSVFSPTVKRAEEDSVRAFAERLPVIRTGFRRAGLLGSELVGGFADDADELLPGDDSSPPSSGTESGA